jgi:hypothetical protein
LIDALGLARIDLSVPHTEPVATAEGLLEIRSAAVVGGSVGQRVLRIDAKTGIIRQQQLIAGDGQTRAQAHASGFEYYPDGQFALPHRVDLSLLVGGQPLSMQIDVSRWVVNQLLTNDAGLFQMPEVAPDKRIDLTVPRSMPQASRLSGTGYVSTADLTPSLRGVERR